MSEGCTRKHGNKKTGIGYNVTISQDEGEICQKIRNNLTSLGLSWRQEFIKNSNPSEKHFKFIIPGKSLYDELKIFGKSKDKFVPDEIKSMSVRQIKIFLDAYSDGDGWFTKSGGVGIKTASRKMADDLHMLYSIVGWTSKLSTGKNKKLKTQTEDSIHYYLQQRVCSSEKHGREKYWSHLLGHHKKIINYTGMVHCVSVPTGAVLCRRNDKPFVSGNCIPLFYEPKRIYYTKLTQNNEPENRWYKKYGEDTPYAGTCDPRSKDQELLWPTRYTEAVARKIAKNLGTYNFSGQLQQLPTPAAGGIYKRDWFTPRYKQLPRDLRWVTAADSSNQGEETSDFFALVAVGYSRATETYYLADVFCERVEYTEQERAYKDFLAKHSYIKKHLVEKASLGYALVSRVKKVIPGIEPITPDKLGPDKPARYRAWAALVENGQFLLPENASWDLEMVIKQFCDAPKGAHDDVLDACTLAVLTTEHALGGSSHIGAAAVVF